MRKLHTLILGIITALSASSQLALKSNLLYDITTTPNLGAELAVSEKNTVNLVYGLNPWTFHSDSKGDRMAKHWVLMPEYRWWLCSTYNGHFLGVHAMGGQFNASNASLFLPGGFVGGDNLVKGVKERRYQGGFAGVGFTYGYQWILSRRWNLEAEVGVGYNYVWYDKFLCGSCGNKLGGGHTNYLGITKLGLSFLYIF